MKSKTILGADGATKMRQITVGSNTYPDRRGSGSRRGRKRQNSPYTFQSGKSGLQGNCAGTHRHRGRNDNRRHCSTERSIKAV